MLFDPRPVDPEFAVEGSSWSPRRQPGPPQCRPPHAVLTLPTLTEAVPSQGTVRYSNDDDYSALARSHFEYGPLRAADVNAPRNAGDALAQAVFAWFRRRKPACRRITFDIDLFDRESVSEYLSHRDEKDAITEQLYLAIELPEENIFAIGAERADALRAVHKDLLPTAMAAIFNASRKTLYLRTPDELLEMYARWWWEYDPTADDEAAREFLSHHHGDDEETIARHLPSVVRASMAPDDVLPHWLRQRPAKRWRPLTDSALRSLSRDTKGDARKLCLAIIAVRSSMRGSPRGCLFGEGLWGDPAYSGACLIYTAGDDYVGELLDDHFEMASQSGEATTYQAYVPIATKASTIRAQFKRWSQALEVIGKLDHLLTLISD